VRDLSTLRVARFRQNEVLRSFAEGLAGPFAFRCECGRARCRELVLVDPADVYDVRANPRRLVLAIGHESAPERVVLEYDRYIVVELPGPSRS
jgi:hypothetical protein